MGELIQGLYEKGLRHWEGRKQGSHAIDFNLKEKPSKTSYPTVDEPYYRRFYKGDPRAYFLRFLPNDIDRLDGEFIKSGTIIASKYEIVNKIGSGTYGAHYTVRLLDSNMTYAAKFFGGLNKYGLKAINEVELLHKMSLRTRNVGMNPIVEYCKIEKHHIFIQPLCIKSLKELLENDYPTGLDLNQTRKIVKDLATALSALVNIDPTFVHGDVKPAKIMMRELGNRTLQAVLIDFGVIPVAFHDGVEISALNYRAPEILFRRAYDGCKVDAWALGVIAVEIFTGNRLFTSENPMDQAIELVEVLGWPRYWWSHGCHAITNQLKKDMLNPFFEEYAPKCRTLKKVLKLGRIWQKKVDYEKGVYSKDNKRFLKAVKLLINYNPQTRLSSSELLRHSFIYKGRETF